MRFRIHIALSKCCTGALTEQHGGSAVCGVWCINICSVEQSSALSLSALRKTAMRIMVDPGSPNLASPMGERGALRSLHLRRAADCVRV